MFRITKIDKGETKQSYSESSFYFEIKIEFELQDNSPNFGLLDKYYTGVVMLDREKYEQHYENYDIDDMFFEDIPENLEIDDMYPENIPNNELKLIKFRTPSPYELGYCKIMEISGRDVINKLDNQKYSYSCFVNSNYITEAAVLQLEEMKRHIDNRYCRYGNYPDQIGAFRSGDTFQDFIGILETLDRFWD